MISTTSACDANILGIYNLVVSWFASVKDFHLDIEVDKPVVIGEFHFGTASHGVWAAGLKPAYSVQNAANCYEQYIKEAAQHPNFIGAHWFQWGDQMPTGRKDGENHRIGLVNVTDQMYQPMADAIKRSSDNLYMWRTGKTVSQK